MNLETLKIQIDKQRKVDGEQFEQEEKDRQIIIDCFMVLKKCPNCGSKRIKQRPYSHSKDIHKCRGCGFKIIES